MPITKIILLHHDHWTKIKKVLFFETGKSLVTRLLPVLFLYMSSPLQKHLNGKATLFAFASHWRHSIFQFWKCQRVKTKQNITSKLEVSKDIGSCDWPRSLLLKWNVLDWPSQSSDLNPTEAAWLKKGDLTEFNLSIIDSVLVVYFDNYVNLDFVSVFTCTV